MGEAGGTFFIGELAERSGVSRDAIRYYESLGLLAEAPRTEAGYRLYVQDDVDRLEFIGQAQALGLALEEIHEVLAMVDEGREPCMHVRERLTARLQDTRDRIRRLRGLERQLVASLAQAQETAHESAAGCHCRIIEAAPVGRTAGGGASG